MLFLEESDLLFAQFLLFRSNFPLGDLVDVTFEAGEGRFGSRIIGVL
jgi:hypothetical protein